ncbi:AraC family transcriptional regulator [Bacillus cereus]|uniref:helix-turn-helix domain-containing protein n=1 Tax=Paenibacillus melissococcoides TaxID=2912268 RepID=UPI0021C3BC7A|nr:AraC family transcriptional regulator [Paenibacillus melissococcoides]MEB9893128.1 AraC family transcriptional regulator [Bacillus cereus]
MREHYGKPLTMARVSNHVSLSYTYLSEAFKRYTGDSFVNDVKKVRLEEAKRLLAGQQNCGHPPPGRIRASQAIYPRF